MGLAEITAEFHSQGIGPTILTEVRTVVRGVVRSYDPVVYGQVWRWDEGVDDLVQEFCIEVLIGQGQLDYAVVVATDENHFRRLLARQLRHHLARRRRRTVVDNILDRCRRLVGSPPFRCNVSRGGWNYTVDGHHIEGGKISDGEIRDIVGRLIHLPRVGANPCVRAPLVYSTETLKDLLETVARASPFAVTASNLDQIFRSLLTCWVPRLLEIGEGIGGRGGPHELSAEDRAIAAEITEKILDDCKGVDRDVLRFKIAGHSDREIGRRLGISRPTVAKRKTRVLRSLEVALAPVDETLRTTVIHRLGAYLEESSNGQRNE